MRSAARWTCILSAFASAAVVRLGHAQAPEGSDRLSPIAVSESLAVLHSIDVSLRSNTKDAAVWYHRGMVAWALYERSRHAPPPRGLDWTLLVPLADTSLRRALEIEPDNQRYFVAVARFLLASGVSFRTYGAYRVFNAEVERARASGNAAALSAAAVEASKMYWLQYDRLACRKVIVGSEALAPAPFVEGLPANFRRVDRAGLNNPNIYSGLDYVGEYEYLSAELLLREAFNSTPADTLAFRKFAMLLADHARWRELASVAHSRIETVRTDGWAWMAMGLAMHRLGNGHVALASFDTGFMVLGDSVRHLLDRVERVLGNQTRPLFAYGTDSARAALTAAYWRNADPLWSVEGNKPRTEFLARITYAQLRWGSDDMGLDGVTSDFGTMYVRTGTWMDLIPPRADDHRMDPCVPQVKAWYSAGDTTVLPGPPVRWGNLMRMRIDTIPTQIARFRGTRDSTDVMFASMPPIAAIGKAAQVVGPVRTDFWVVAGGLTDVVRDSVRPSTPKVQEFVARLASGPYVYRTEASADGSILAARGTAGFVAGPDARTGFALSGFGMSDFVLASAVTPHRGPVRRWTDFDVKPLVGPVSAGAELSLLWENYELGNSNGTARYGVAITLQREAVAGQSSSGNIAASIVGRIAGAVGVTRSADRIEITVERTAPYAETIPDDITIALGKTPPGNYLLTLRVTDRMSGAVTGRTQRLTIPAPPPPKPTLYGR